MSFWIEGVSLTIVAFVGLLGNLLTVIVLPKLDRGQCDQIFKLESFFPEKLTLQFCIFHQIIVKISHVSHESLICFVVSIKNGHVNRNSTHVEICYGFDQGIIRLL